MELYFGGAYNGKLRRIKEKVTLAENDIFCCGENEIDFSKTVICGIHVFIYSEVINGRDAMAFFKKNIEGFKDKIIISDDLSSGIVPLKKEDRKWREETGKVLQFLTSKSNKVTRVFCGLPMVLKDE